MIVSIIFEEMAEEEDLFSARQQAIAARGLQTINGNQVNILEGIISSRAEKAQCTPELLRMVFVDAYEIKKLEELPRHQFKEAIRYLLQFAGVN